jgi:hypothetical protein
MVFRDKSHHSLLSTCGKDTLNLDYFDETRQDYEVGDHVFDEITGIVDNV